MSQTTTDTPRPTPPRPTPAERESHATFHALLQSLSLPGRLQSVAGDSFLMVARALLDLEVSYSAPDPALAAALRQTGARPALPEEADYLFSRDWDAATLADLARARVGTPLAPDHSATLLLCAVLDGSGPQFTLSGPGVKGAIDVSIGGVPGAFWALRQDAIRFPLGWDALLLDEAAGRVLGLPRTTQVEPAGAVK